jgi:hypothetical protein
VGVFFGFVRGLAIVPGRSLTSLAAVNALHRRLDAWSEPSRRLTVAAQCAIAFGALLVAGLAWPVVVALAVATTLLAVAGRRRALAL